VARTYIVSNRDIVIPERSTPKELNQWGKGPKHVFKF
jgi:hypothetical protein